MVKDDTPPEHASGLIGHNNPPESPLLSEVIETLRSGGKTGLAAFFPIVVKAFVNRAPACKIHLSSFSLRH